MANILVTGGAGFVGLHIMEAFFENGLETSVVYFNAWENVA